MAEPAEAQELQSRQQLQPDVVDSLWPSEESPESCVKNCLAKHLLAANSHATSLTAAEEHLQQHVATQKSACQQPLPDLLSSDDHFDISTSGRTLLVRLKVEYLKQSAQVMRQVNAIWPVGTGPENAAKHTLAKHMVYTRDPAKYSMQAQDACGLLKGLLPESKAVTNKYQLKNFLYSDPFFSIMFTAKNDGVVKLKVPRLLSVNFVQAKGKGGAGKSVGPSSYEFDGDVSSNSNSETDVSSAAVTSQPAAANGKPSIDEINAVIDVVFPPNTGAENETKGMVAKRLALEGVSVPGGHSMPLANIGNFLKEQSRDAWANCKGGLRFAFANDPYFELSRWNTNWKVCLRLDALFAAAAAQTSAAAAARNINKPAGPVHTATTASPASSVHSSSDPDTGKPGALPNGTSRSQLIQPNVAPSNRNKHPSPSQQSLPLQPRPNGMQLPFHIAGGSNVSILALPKDVAQLIDQEWPSHGGAEVEYKNFVAKVLVSKGDPSLGLYAMTLAKLGQHLRRFASDFKLKESLARDDRFEISHTSVTEVVVRLLLDKFHGTNSTPKPTPSASAPAGPKEQQTAAPAPAAADVSSVQKHVDTVLPKPRQQSAPNAGHRHNPHTTPAANNSRPAPASTIPPGPAASPAPAPAPTASAAPPADAAPVVPTPELYKKLFTCKGSRALSGNPEWRYKDQSGNKGPVSADQIQKLCEQRRITDDTPVCGCTPDVKHPNLPGSKFYKPLSSLLALVASGACYDPVTKADVKRAKPSPGWNEPSGGAAAAASASAAPKSAPSTSSNAPNGPRAGAGAHAGQQHGGPAPRGRPGHGGPDHPMLRQGAPHMRGNMNNMHSRPQPGNDRGFGMRPGSGLPGSKMDRLPTGRPQSQLHVNAMPFVPASLQGGQPGARPGQPLGFGPPHSQALQQVGASPGGQVSLQHGLAQMAALAQGQMQAAAGAPKHDGSGHPSQQQPASSIAQQPNVSAASLFASSLMPRGLQGLGMQGMGMGLQPGSIVSSALNPASPAASPQITSLSAGLDATHSAAPNTLHAQQQQPSASAGLPASSGAATSQAQSQQSQGTDTLAPQPQAQALQGADFLGSRPLLQPRVPSANPGLPHGMSMQEMQLLHHYQLLQQQQRQQHAAQQHAFGHMGQPVMNMPPQSAPLNVQRELAFQLFAHGKQSPPEQPLWWFADQVVVHGPFFAGQMIEWFLQGIIKEDLRVCCTTQDFQRPLTPPLNRFHSVAELIMMLGKGVLLPPLPRSDVVHNPQYHQFMLPMMMSAANAQQQGPVQDPHSHFLGAAGSHQHHLGPLLNGIQSSQGHGF